LSTGDAHDTGDGDAPQGIGCDEDKDQGGEVSVGQDPRRVRDSAIVSAARAPPPPKRRVDLTRGRAAQATKRRRFEEMAGAAGFDLYSRILDSMDWDDWNDGGASSSEEADEEEP